jgi:N-carbamoylputrescine amidase
MPRTLVAAALQTHHDWDETETVGRVIAMAESAAKDGARLILPSELFAAPYFCKAANDRYRALARPADGHPLIAAFAKLARAHQAVVPCSFYEKGEDGLYNSVAVIDADGEVLGIYRKTHIPDFPGYVETHYFKGSREGAKVWATRYCRLGVGICWDQWFPELARMMVLAGAEVLAYPTAIGSEPEYPDWDTAEQWQSAMRGHAAANLVPVVAANRTGIESDDGVRLSFYGSSFVCDHRAHMLKVGPRNEDAIVMGELDLDRARRDRTVWGVFQTRRPDVYGALATTPAARPPDAASGVGPGREGET